MMLKEVTASPPRVRHKYVSTDLNFRLSQALDWFKTRSLAPGPFRYRIAGDVIRLRSRGIGFFGGRATGQQPV